MSWTTDNRWSPGASGATVPADAPAAYSARWIDMGDHTPADVLWDRQGLAYNDERDRDRLIDKLTACGDATRTPYKVHLMERDVTTVLFNHPAWKMYARRAGGYIYVDAWLVPAVSETETVCAYCGTAIYHRGGTVWVDDTDGDACWGDINLVNENEPHTPEARS